MNAGSFAQAVIHAVVSADERASFLSARPRGKTAVIGYLDVDEWVPIFRITGGSGAYNVASLQVRHGTTWQPTLVRGVPAAVAEQLVGPLRFLWEQHAHYSQSW
jgi:hypothetical protein